MKLSEAVIVKVNLATVTYKLSVFLHTLHLACLPADTGICIISVCHTAGLCDGSGLISCSGEACRRAQTISLQVIKNYANKYHAALSYQKLTFSHPDESSYHLVSNTAAKQQQLPCLGNY